MLLTRGGWLLSIKYESLAWLSTADGVVTAPCDLAAAQNLKDEIVFFLFFTYLNG